MARFFLLPPVWMLRINCSKYDMTSVPLAFVFVLYTHFKVNWNITAVFEIAGPAGASDKLKHLRLANRLSVNSIVKAALECPLVKRGATEWRALICTRKSKILGVSLTFLPKDCLDRMTCDWAVDDVRFTRNCVCILHRSNVRRTKYLQAPWVFNLTEFIAGSAFLYTGISS